MTNLDIYDLLQSKTATVVVNHVVAFAKDRSPQTLSQIVMQLFVDCLDRAYDVKPEDTSFEDEDALNDIVWKIFDSEKQESNKEVIRQSFKDFFIKFFPNGFGCGVLSGSLVISWARFLQSFATHPDIPEHHVLKGRAIHFAAMLLNPLGLLLQKVDANAWVTRSDLSDEITIIEDALSIIVHLIPDGFNYRSLCVPIAIDFVDGMKEHHEILISKNRNYLSFYKKLLNKENNNLQIIALKSLTNLCYNQHVTELLTEFFFTEPGVGDIDEESFMTLLRVLINFERKAIKIDVIGLLKAMKDMLGDREILTGDMRIELFMNIFGASTKLALETVELMLALEEDVWLQVIDLMNHHISENVDLRHMIDLLSSVQGVGCKAEDLIEIMIANLNKPETSQRAATIVVEMLKRDVHQQDLVLEVIDSVLKECVKDERTFVLMLECINIMDLAKLSEFFKVHHATKLETILDYLSGVFKSFNSPVSLFKIVNTMSKLSLLAPVSVLNTARQLFNKYYSDLLDVYKRLSTGQDNADPLSSDYKAPLTKLTVLLENRAWNVIGKTAIPIIYRINENLSKDTTDAALFSLVVRFHTNFLKHLWARMVNNMSIEMDCHELSDGITSFVKSLNEFVDIDDEMDLKTGYLLVSSFMDLLVMFQPDMSQRYSHSVFQTASVTLSKDVVKELTAKVERLVFQEKGKIFDDDTMYQREMLLLTFVAFHKNYTNLPSLTASEKIVRHYCLRDPLQVHLDILLEYLMAKNIFDQVVAFAAFNLSNLNDMTQFKSFYYAIDTFIQNHSGNTKIRSSTVSSICSFMLNKLKTHVEMLQEDEVANRLTVLDYIEIFIKNLDTGIKQNLQIYIADDLDGLLTDEEKAHLEAFKAKLRE